MLSLNDVKGIARARFFSKNPWQWDSWILNIVSVWILIALILIVVSMFIYIPSSSTPHLVYVIPQSVIEQGKDVQVMYQWSTGYTVNGYLLTTVAETDAAVGSLKAMFLWLTSILVFLPMIGMFIYVAVREAMLTRYIDSFASTWAVKKELPE